MATAWREPYHVVIEVENKQCKMVKKLATLGFKHLKVIDVRSSSSGSVKHLMDLGEEQAKKCPKSWLLLNIGKVNRQCGWKVKAAKSATPS
jgi:hypothetical protein